MSVKEGDSLSLFSLPGAPPSPSPDPLSAEKDSPKDPQFDDAFSAMSSKTDRSISLLSGDDGPEANSRSMEDPTTLSREGPGKDVLVDENVEQSGNSRGDTLGKVLTKPHLSGGDSTSTTREEGPGKAILVEKENVEPSDDSDLNSLGKVPSNPHSLGGISTSTSEEGLDKGNMKVSLVDENVTLSDNSNPDPLGKGSTKPTHAREEEEKEEENLTLGDLINGENVQSRAWDEAKKEIDTDWHRSNGDSDEKDDRISEENGDSEIHSFPSSHIDSAASSRDSKGLTSFPTSNEPFKQPSTKQTGSGVDLLQNITAGDEEGRSRQRILAFAAKRYASAVERNPNDYDALYNWALILQESADNINLDAGSPGKDQLLEEACKKYDEATRLCPTLHEAFYNWAIAISDRAKIRGRTKEAEDLWKQACKKYEEAVQLNWNSPQALNNWGLALQELSGIVPVKDKRLIVRTAIKKFRAAILLQFDFHRAIYNLGTVLYGLAEDTFRSGKQNAAKELTSSDLYGQSAVYIASAHALKPEYPVYRSALRLVRSMLPLPYLKTGFLMVPPDGNSLAPHSDWKRLLFALDHEALFQLDRAEQDAMDIPSLSDKAYALHVEIADIALAAPCGDLTLPPGGGIRIDTAHSQLYLVADTWEAVDCWVDAIRLAYTIYVRGQSDMLAGVIVN